MHIVLNVCGSLTEVFSKSGHILWYRLRYMYMYNNGHTFSSLMYFGVPNHPIRAAQKAVKYFTQISTMS